ncbi:hypothetical protein ACIRQH_35080 [Streptomyces sp. NPDC102279]|uniref:hypothetical protein n=1 Tax=Streptomyces sp. NPDC102279 TaxID=3366153 RepID=UPI0037F2527E
MIARMTWAPDSGPIQTLTVDVSESWFTEFRRLISTPEWAASQAVMAIPFRLGSNGPWTGGLFRLACITALDPHPTKEGTTP